MRTNTSIPRQTPLGPKPGLLRLRSLTRWAAGIRANRPRLCPTRRMRRGEAKWVAWERALEKARDRIRRRLARRFGPLGPHNVDAFLGALDQAKTAYVLSNNAAAARLHGRRGLLARKAPRPRAPAVVVPRTAPTAPGEGPSAQGPPDPGEGNKDSESDGEPPSPSPRPRRARGRGRPRKARRFRAHPNGRVYRRRIGALNAVAEALEGRADGLFLTLTPLEPPDERARRLAAVPADVARAFADFAARLRRAGATYALVIATRADGGAYWPHAHALVAGVDPARLAKWAALEGLHLYSERLRDPRGAARYLARAGQKAYYDGIFGARGFYTNTPGPVSPGNSQGVKPSEPAAIPPGLELAPGVRIANPDRFLAALARDLESRLPAVRDAACHRLALLPAALAERGPP